MRRHETGRRRKTGKANAMKRLILLFLVAGAVRVAGAADLTAELGRQYADLQKELGRRDWYKRVAAQAYDPQALVCPEDRDAVDVALRRTEALLREVQALGPKYDLTAAAKDLTRLKQVAATTAPAVAVTTKARAPARSPRTPVAILRTELDDELDDELNDEAYAMLAAAFEPEARAPARPPKATAAVVRRELGDEPNDEAYAVPFAASDVVPVGAPGTREALFIEIGTVRRQIALANPLLDFNQLLFIKRVGTGANHMCDQYYGKDNRAGGGVFVLADPFGPAPRLRDVLADAVVESGRLKGQKLATGAFLSPALSYDGRTIYFAYCEKTGPGGWSEGQCFHIFKVNVDGSGLAQLTDGKWNDFDPCPLPNGRVAFVSERRGGYLRCSGSRPCPTYTLHSMRPDGDDIRCLSFHETNEWHPSVNHDGMIVYTRWDYVDRDTNAGHHLWTCSPDGRDPRSFHGNYPSSRNARPWGEWSNRAIPGRRNAYVATAGAHHGPAFGSLVIVDMNLEDDGAMSQVRRLTPEAPFPEAETYNKQYGTVWPLSDRHFLCAYDAAGVNHGLYLADAFGNKELIYRDPAINCHSPQPLRARPAPPVVPEQAVGGAAGTLLIANVYDADFAWPTGTKIAGLRVVQLLPKTNPPKGNPRIGVAGDANARLVLGTVSVETDGSAHFTVPAGKPIYFQALDERGLAVQSMRSVTYLQPGERLTCQGCHEPKRQAPPVRAAPPIAARRAPSSLQPEAEGSNPFNYVRLVQPVLDRHCVACHQQKKAPDLTGAPGQKDFTRSYDVLTKDQAFYFNSFNGSFGQKVHGGSRTTAGEFGARASGLLRMLDKGHNDVKLPPDDLRRLTLWLDCNSDFLGAYHDAEDQRLGMLVHPKLE